MLQFKLRTMFLIVLFITLWMGYVVNYTEQQSVCLVSFVGPAGRVCWLDPIDDDAITREAAELEVQESFRTAANLVSSQDMMSSVIDEAGDVSVLRNQKDPKTWLRQRLEVNLIRPGSDVLIIQLIRSPYRDRDNPDDYPLILEAVLRVLERNSGEHVSLQTIQYPTPAT